MTVRRRHFGFLCTGERKEELRIEGLSPGSVVTCVFDKETEAELGDTAEDRCLHMLHIQIPDLKVLEIHECQPFAGSIHPSGKS